MTQPIHTPGPVETYNPAAGCKNDGLFWQIRECRKDEVGARKNIAAELSRDDARLLAAAYNAFDSAARVLGCNAVELAETMLDGALLAELLGNIDSILYHTPHLEKEAFGKVEAVLPK